VRLIILYSPDFRRTGFLPSLSVLPFVRALTVYNEENFGYPVQLNFETWMVNKITLQNLGLKMPPPLENWGEAWWESWNMGKLQEYVDKMRDAGLNNLINLPRDFPDSDTRFVQYLGFSYGASVLNSSGRCGLDEKMEAAIRDTIYTWRQQSNWTMDFDTNLYNFTNVLPWRGVYSHSKEEFLAWMRAPPKENPADEPMFTFASPSAGGTNSPQVTLQPGFAYSDGYGPGFAIIYPPTSPSAVQIRLVKPLANTVHCRCCPSLCYNNGYLE